MATAAISTRHNGDAREVQLSEGVIRQHALTQETAQRLSVTALRQWEKALTGIIALPTAERVEHGGVGALRDVGARARL